jgi:phytoene/squalene synthetase
MKGLSLTARCAFSPSSSSQRRRLWGLTMTTPKGLPTTKTLYPEAKHDLVHAVRMVQSHDPAGYLPGRLLPTPEMQWTYYAVRSFWVETGLRFGTTALVPPNSTPKDHLEWWSKQVANIYKNVDHPHGKEMSIGHPTLRLLYSLIRDVQSLGSSAQTKTQLSQCHFTDILKGRMEDLEIRQYETLNQLEQHSTWSCGSLSQLVLESDGIFELDYPLPHEAAKLVGKAHGLTNALRLSIPIVSTTGKLVIPQDLCQKYGVTSPRYLLSALGQGDEKCIQAMQHTVQEIVSRARLYIEQARQLRDDILALDANDGATDAGKHTVVVLLPTLTAETFLKRLESCEYDLTNRGLRNVTVMEHLQCASNLLTAKWQQKY